MPVRALVVDDSRFFRRRIVEMLGADPRIEVVGEAVDGKDAIARTKELKPDVITMDIEMPVMDGITAVRKIMEECPTPILMFSSLTTEGAQPTLDALEAGALDFLPKRLDDLSGNHEEAVRLLRSRVFTIGVKGRTARREQAKGPPTAPKRPTPSATPKPAPAPAKRTGDIEVVAIGTSTGGPVALQRVLTQLPADFPVPLVMFQHMPGTFTPAFAKRLDTLCKINVRQAEDGDALKPGVALLAPGGMQMTVERRRPGTESVHIEEGEATLNYKPSVDLGFSSLAKSYGGGVLAVVLTGMGADGREGARALHAAGSTVWAQDEASSVVYGMPAAVADAGLAERILPLDDVGTALAKAVR
ncbi:MAG: protein-glutamate methylesterase/protein-glutamine glutaminase [Pseudomonadota bacterium]